MAWATAFIGGPVSVDLDLVAPDDRVNIGVGGRFAELVVKSIPALGRGLRPGWIDVHPRVVAESWPKTDKLCGCP